MSLFGYLPVDANVENYRKEERNDAMGDEVEVDQVDSYIQWFYSQPGWQDLFFTFRKI